MWIKFGLNPRICGYLDCTLMKEMEQISVFKRYALTVSRVLKLSCGYGRFICKRSIRYLVIAAILLFILNFKTASKLTSSLLIWKNISIDVKYLTQPSEITNVSVIKQPTEETNLTQNISGLHKGTIVTLFTTFKDTDIRKVIHHRTLTNWASLKPYVHPVLFVPGNTSIGNLSSTAIAKGWTVKTLAKQHLNQSIPILKSMFKDIQKSCESPFMGFANADILFNNGLLNSLRHLFIHTKNVTKEMMLIIGRRRNVNVTIYDLQNGDNLTKIEKISQEIPNFGVHAIDYFIVTKLGLDWDKIPKFVVGRIGYDNWLVSKSIEWNVTVIDASRTILALHQTGHGGIHSGFHADRATLNINKLIVGKYNYFMGRTSCAPWMFICSEQSLTEYNGFMCKYEQLSVVKTPKRLKACFPRMSKIFE